MVLAKQLSHKHGGFIRSAHDHGLVHHTAHHKGSHGAGRGHHDVAHGHHDHRAGTHNHDATPHAGKGKAPHAGKGKAAAVTAPAGPYNGADAQIARLLGGAPTADTIKAFVDALKAAPEPTKPGPAKYVSADEQIAAFFGSAKPSSAQILAAGTPASSDGDVLKELEILEAQFASIETTLLGIQSGVKTTADELVGLEKQYNIVPPAKGKCGTAAPAPAAPTDVTNSMDEADDITAPITGGLLTIAKTDKITSALRGFLERAFPAGSLKISENPVPVSKLVDGSTVLEGPLAIFARLTPGLMGRTALEKAVVQQWCGFALSKELANAPSQLSPAKLEVFKAANDQLADRCFFAGNAITLADLFMWAAADSWLRPCPGSLREMPFVINVTRWFQHVQYTRGLCAKSALITICNNAINLPGAH